MPSLFVIQGRDQGTRFELDEAHYSIGRVGSNSIQIHDTEVSREHASLVRDGNVFRLRDLGSSNGTYVNGNPFKEGELATGDQVQIGRTLLLFTGYATAADDLTDQISIVSRPVGEEESRIVHSLRHSEESDFLTGSPDASASPWLARARSNLQVMYRTALAVSHTLNIDELLGRIMDLIFEWVDADRGCIMLKEQETDELVPKTQRHRRGVGRDDRIAISKTILDFVTDRNEGVLTSNARDDERWDPTKSIVRLGVREAICVPMQGRYKMVGVIYIDTSTSPANMLAHPGARKFNEEHLKLMVAIGHQAALAVEDTNYYKAMVQAERLAAVGQTIASLSHHVKNVLQGVRGGSYLIELGLDDHAQALDGSEIDVKKAITAVETIQKGWRIVERNQERISALVMDMLTFSKNREPELAEANLNTVTVDAVESLQARADEMSVRLEFEATETVPEFLFDAEGIHRAILNVVTNAIDACDLSEDGLVQVKTALSDDGQFAHVIVHDNGCGVEPADVDQIFKIFVSRKGGRGTGLGLSVSQKIVKEHGGQIRVESQPGVGSTFTLELPIAPAANEAPKQTLHA